MSIFFLKNRGFLFFKKCIDEIETLDTPPTGAEQRVLLPCRTASDRPSGRSGFLRLALSRVWADSPIAESEILVLDTIETPRKSKKAVYPLYYKGLTTFGVT